MRRILASAFLSLDGVMQAPGGPSEDWTGGFAHGGWTPPYADEDDGGAIGQLFDRPFDLLLGRKTYEIFAAYWPYYDEAGPDGEGIAMPFNACAKYVLTRHADQPLDWANSHRLDGIAAVAALKAGDGPDLVIQGSSTLYPALLAAGLIDWLMTLTYPVTLGKGKRLFGEGTPARAMRLVGHQVTKKGVIVAQYEPAGDVATGSFPGPEPSAAEQARQERMRREG